MPVTSWTRGEGTDLAAIAAEDARSAARGVGYRIIAMRKYIEEVDDSNDGALAGMDEEEQGCFARVGPG